MKLKKVECKQFAGLRDKKVEFSDGLNVVYGKNEAGKSTIVEAISNTIFKDAKLGSRSKEDKEFKKLFFPYPNGDFAESFLEIENNGDVLKINKKWSDKNPSSYLEIKGTKISDEKRIKEEMLKIFSQGEATYNKLVFQRQRDFKESIQKIAEDKDVRNSIFEFVSTSTLELDGVSIEDLKANIDNEIKELTNSWDMDKEMPLNNRGINNQYVKNVGLILGSYYNKERAKLELEEVIKKEDERDEVLKSLKELEKEYTVVKRELDELKAFEKDALQRAAIEPKKDRLKAEYDKLIEVQKIWPQYQTKLDDKKKELVVIEENIKNLIKEEEQNIKAKEKEEIEKKLKQVKEKLEQVEDLKKKLDELKEISEQDVRNLEKIRRDIERLENQINLGEFTVSINIKNRKPIYLTKDLEEKSRLEESIQATAKGYAKVETDDFDFEIKLKDFDVEKIREEYVKLKSDYAGILEKFGVKDVDEAREIATKRNKLSVEIVNKKNEIQIVLGEDTIDALEKRLVDIGNVNVTRSIDEIRREKMELDNKKITILADIKNIESTLKEWENKYKSLDELFNRLVDVMSEIKMLDKELDKLKPLPEGFTSVMEFNEYLNDIKEKEQNLFGERGKLQQQYYTIELELQNKKSSKDLEEEIRIYEENYKNYLKKAKNLIKLKELIDDTLNDINNNTFAPIVDSFNKYLAHITGDKYKVKDFKESLEFEIGNDTSNLSIDLLSTGTYDTVALALKFALIENMFDNETFIVLDDCLVDLDEDRKQKAAELIKEFAKKHQVIFTTCSMDTANLLEGNLICL
jgi:exonuclease SbcC